MSETAHGEIIPKSLREVFTEANQIEEIIGENPLVTISLYRLLIAILHDCLQGPKDYDEWGELWESESFDAEKLNNYFSENESNFYLFDDEKPFYQTAKLRQIEEITPPQLGDEIVKPIWKFFMEGEKFTTLFEHKNKESQLNLMPAEAARFLIAYQNFDIGGSQSRIEEGLNKKEIGLIKSAYAGLLNKCAVGLIRDGNLFNTLLLNFIRYDQENEIPFSNRGLKDTPIWRRNKPINPAEDKKIEGYVDLLTWQSRQIKLYPTRDVKGDLIVNDVVVMKGNNLDGDLFRKEQMVAFKKVVKEKKKVWTSISFRQDRVLWRDSLSLFQMLTDDSSRPETLNWLSDLIKNGKLENSVFPIDFFGMGGNQAKPLFWRHERLPMPTLYLNNVKLCDELGKALKLSEIVAGILAASVFRMATLHFLPDVRLEAKGWLTPALYGDKLKLANERFETFKKKSHKRSEDKDEFKTVKGKAVGVIPKLIKSLSPELRYWSLLETPFRHLLLALAEDSSKWKDERENWADELEKTALRAFGEVAFSLGNSPRSLRSVSIARNWLKAELTNRKRKYTNFEKFDDEIEKQEQEEEVEDDES